ncbi:DNA-binding protein, partial [Escherichia coli]
LNSRGYTRVEPGDELLRPEEPGMLAEAIEMLDDATWLRILMKTGLSQDLIRELFSINRPITNPRNIFQIV